MWRLSVKQLIASWRRLVLTLLAVVLGVTFVTGSLVLTDTSQKVFDDQFRTASAGVDLSVRDAVAFDAGMGVEVERDPLPSGLVDRVSGVPGVAKARAMVRGQGLLVVDGEAIVPRGPSMLSSWAPQPFGAFTLREGRAPNGGADLVVDAATAATYGIELGDTVTVQAAREADLTVVGIAGFGEEDGLPNTTVALVGTGTGQRLLDLGRGVSEVAVVADDAVATSRLQDGLAETLGPSYEVASSQDAAAASAAAAKTSLSYLQTLLFGLGAAALLVGAFLIANTFAIVVTQRTRELAVLRAVGATGRQVVASVWVEALLLGVVGSALGVGGGILAASGLRSVVGAFGIALPDQAMVVAPRTVALAFLLGVAVTATAAAGPSRKAARVAPVAALREGAAGAGRTGRGRLTSGVAAGALATVLLGAVLLTGLPVVLLALSGIGAVLALVLLGPVLAPVLARTVGRPLQALGVPGTMARQAAARAPRRTAATVTALAVGLALVSFMTVVASSLKASIASSYEETISADYVVESARGEMLGGLPAHLHHEIAARPEVDVASRLRYGHWKDGDVTRALTAVEPATLAKVANADMVAGDLAGLSGGGVVLAEATARERGLEVGDRLPMTFSRTGEQRLRVVGLMADEDAQALSTAYLISLATFERQFSENVDASVLIDVAAGVSPEAAATALEEALADFPTADLRDQAAAVDSRTASVDQILGLVTVLLGFTVLIALLGITNTLALSVTERTREIGLLRAVGMTRRQLGAMVRAEAGLVAAVALVLALALGTGFGAAVITVLGREAPVEVSIPAAQLGVVVLVATLGGVLAGLLPARRAGRMDVLTAIGGQ